MRNNDGMDSKALTQLTYLMTSAGVPQVSYSYPIKAPELPPNVVPPGRRAKALTMDSAFNDYLTGVYSGGGFPGYPYLAQLMTRAEYRNFASGMATELTREWIEFTSKGDKAEKIKIIEEEFDRLNVREVFSTAAEHDCAFGRAQIFIDIAGADIKVPLILDPRTIRKNSLKRICTVEAMWTTPVTYNANDPTAPDFYKPTKWFMLGKEVHASRLMTIITRQVPDMLKPAFNFGGISLSQLAEPYVDNWLRTRQSVSDLIHSFSITALATDMAQALQDGGDAKDVVKRAQAFTAGRDNFGLFLLNKDTEELVQVNTPLSGLHELQAQAQEHMCSVSRMPAIVLTGISPSGLNASSDGEIRIFYDWIAAIQTSYYLGPLYTVLDAVQLSKFGEIDPDIGINYVPLYQQTPKELSEIRKTDAEAAATYVDLGAISPAEVREKLARDPNSGYMGIDPGDVPEPPEPEDDGMGPTDKAPPDGDK